MPRFAMLLYYPAPGDWSAVPPDEWEAYGDEPTTIVALGGTEIAGFAPQPTTTAKAVRAGGVTDGPFVDSAYVLGDFGVIEARDLEHALEIAKLNPATWRGGVEVRPVL